jgi:hypothetical protein
MNLNNGNCIWLKLNKLKMQKKRKSSSNTRPFLTKTTTNEGTYNVIDEEHLLNLD